MIVTPPIFRLWKMRVFLEHGDVFLVQLGFFRSIFLDRVFFHQKKMWFFTPFVCWLNLGVFPGSIVVFGGFTGGSGQEKSGRTMASKNIFRATIPTWDIKTSTTHSRHSRMPGKNSDSFWRYGRSNLVLELCR